MKRSLCGCFVTVAYLVTHPLVMEAVQSSPYMGIRSQGVNAVRDMVGWQELINRDARHFYGASSLVIEYDHSFRAGRIANAIFNGDENFNNDSGVLTISGSRAPSRGTIQWLADYFGLPTDFISTIEFKPKIKNIILNPNIYLGFGNQEPGFYAFFDFPIVLSSWALNFKEQPVTLGTQGYSAGYFSDEAIPASSLLQNAASFFTGHTPTLIKADGSKIPFDALNVALWSPCALKKVRLADIAAELGYNFLITDSCYLGIKFRAAAPTGNKPEGVYVLEPMVGNGGHWEVGGGLLAHTTLCKNEETGAVFSFYLNANLTHLCKAHQRRVFDLCAQGANSRYMLAERLAPVTNGLEGSAQSVDLLNSVSVMTPSNFQFADRYSPVANLTSRDVLASAALQADVAFKFCYKNGRGCSWDLGYNFWAITHEKLCSAGCVPSPFEHTNWALKGDAAVYGFVAGTALPVALAPSESDSATIHTGANGFEPGDDTTANNSAAITNQSIDNAQFAYQNGIPVQALPNSTNVFEQTHTSIQPNLLVESDLDMRSTVALSHKFFANFDYTGKDRGHYKPFISVGASAEFARNSYDEEIPACINARSPFRYNKAGISQWAVWTKVGLAFDYGSPYEKHYKKYSRHDADYSSHDYTNFGHDYSVSDQEETQMDTAPTTNDASPDDQEETQSNRASDRFVTPSAASLKWYHKALMWLFSKK